MSFSEREGALPTEVYATLSAMLLALLLALLLYPGLLFGIVLALVGEWLRGALRPVLTSRLYRVHTRPRHLLQPVYDFLKLSGRQGPQGAGADTPSGALAANEAQGWLGMLGMASAIAPVLALALLPFPGSPVTQQIGFVGDLFTVLLLLAVPPLTRVAARLSRNGIASLTGTQDAGRLLHRSFRHCFVWLP